jgi:hypothetical protein
MRQRVWKLNKILIVSMRTAIFLLQAFAGRAPNPVQVAQPLTDRHMTCMAIQAELTNNNTKIRMLAEEKSKKRTQNVVAGTVGAVLFFPALFMMDFQGAAKQELQALEARNNYLAALSQKCNGVNIAGM